MLPAAGIYEAFMNTHPLSKVVYKLLNLPLVIIWERLWRPHVVMEAANISFQLLHNISVGPY